MQLLRKALVRRSFEPLGDAKTKAMYLQIKEHEIVCVTDWTPGAKWWQGFVESDPEIDSTGAVSIKLFPAAKGKCQID